MHEMKLIGPNVHAMANGKLTSQVAQTRSMATPARESNPKWRMRIEVQISDVSPVQPYSYIMDVF